MTQRTLLRLAWRSILKNKMRTLLTMLGIVIGVGAVIVMVAVGRGAQSQIEAQISSLGLSAKIGITPMIGVNDVASEVFTLADAQALLDYAQTDSNVARLSMWSVARDNGNTAGAHYASPDSSGIAQQPYDFSAIFHHFDLMV